MTTRSDKIKQALEPSAQTVVAANPTAVPPKTVKAGYKMVNRVVYGEETESNEQIAVADFQGEPTGHVTVSAHVTKNLGNYESAKVSVEVCLPVLASSEEVVRVYSEVNELVSEMINEQLEALKS